MVATDSAVLPWSRPSLAGAPPPDARKYGHAQAQNQAQNQAQALNAPKDAAADEGGFHPFGKEGFSFFDLIDVVNPLQHIPIIGTLYREMTGDTLDALPRIAGSTLFFGPLGAAFSTANVVVEEVSGQDIGDHIMTALRDGGEGLGTVAAADATGAPAHAVSVVATKPAAAGTDGAATIEGLDDPVSAWARGEIAYRQALARDRQIAAAGAAATSTSIATGAAPELSWAAASLIGADAGAGETDPRRAAAAYRHTAGVATRATEASGIGAAAPGGGWFAANMIDSLARYQRRKAPDDGAATPPGTPPSTPLGTQLGTPPGTPLGSGPGTPVPALN